MTEKESSISDFELIVILNI